MQFYIYKITNKINKKSYIGIAKNTRSRFQQHIKGYADSQISRAIKKYGVEKFIFEILEAHTDKKEASRRESFYIDHFKCIVPSGYNLVSYLDYRPVWHKKSRAKLQAVERQKPLSGYYGVYFEKRNGLFETNIRIDTTRYQKYFKNAIEAAECYDKLVLYGFGKNGKFNFPEKIQEYLKEDLEYLSESILDKTKSSKYIGVSYDKGCLKWGAMVYVMKVSCTRPTQIRVGYYNSEEEAAVVRDKCVLWLGLPRKLNFPQRKNEFLKEDLKSLYESLTTKKKSKYKWVSRNTKSGRWHSYKMINNKAIHLGYFDTEQQAFEAVKPFYPQKYLNELTNK